MGDGFAFLSPGSPKASFHTIASGRSFAGPWLAEELRQVDQGELEHLRIRAGLVAIPQEIGPGELPQEGAWKKTSSTSTRDAISVRKSWPASTPWEGKKESGSGLLDGTEPPDTNGSVNGEKSGFEEHVHARKGELEWQSFMKMEFLNWMKTVCLSATRKGEESKGCERRRIHQTSGEGFSKHGSRTRRRSENGKSTGQACRTKGKREQKLENHRITAVVGTSVYGAQGLLKPDEKGDLDEK